MGSRRSLALVMEILWVLAVCSSRPAYGAPPSDPCSLLTQAQVSAALGLNVGTGQVFAKRACEWSVPGKATGLNAKKVLVTLQDERAFAYAKMPVGHSITKTPVSGIGDDAVYGTTPGFATVLTVRKGSLAFVVHVYGIDPTRDIDQIKAKERTLALEILSKL